MTRDNKELLFKDLCARSPYGVKCFAPDHEYGNIGKLWCIEPFEDSDPPITVQYQKGNTITKFCSEIKPYLRPMSSMTEEEKKDILQSLNIHGDIDNEGNLLLGVECDIITLKVCKKYLAELNKRMFDVCHMIEKGLAIEAPEDMYKISD